MTVRASRVLNICTKLKTSREECSSYGFGFVVGVWVFCCVVFFFVFVFVFLLSPFSLCGRYLVGVQCLALSVFF